MRLEWQVTLVVVGVASALVGGLGLGVASALDAWALEVVDARLAERAQALASSLEEEHGELDVEDEGEGARGGWFRVERADGSVALGSPGWPAALPTPNRGAVTVAREQLPPVRVWSTVLERPRGGPWTLRVAATLDAELRLAQRVRSGLGLGALAAVALAALAGFFLTRRVFAPLGRLVREVDALAPTSPTARLEAAGLSPELGRLASSFNALLARVSASLAAQRDFTARASHALKTPLATVLTQAEVALRQQRDADAYRRALQDIAQTARDAAHLAEGLLALRRADGSGPGLEVALLDVGPVLERARRLCEPRAEAAGVKLTLGTDAGGVRCLGAAVALDECLDALLDNAVRYTPRGGAVVLDARTEGAHVLVEVRDTGPGFAPGEERRAFERFFRGRAAEGTSSGSGLGLALVKALVEAQGGAVELGSAPEGGARVTLRLRSGAAAA